MFITFDARVDKFMDHTDKRGRFLRSSPINLNMPSALKKNSDPVYLSFCEGLGRAVIVILIVKLVLIDSA